MKKNDKVIGTCTSYTYDGHGVVKIDGFPLFVKGLMLGECAEIVVTMVKKTFGYGKYLNIQEKSPERVEPICPIAHMCGGCQLQHMSLQHQCAFKKSQVEEVMQRIAHIDTPVEDVLTMENPYHYRNKAQIPVGCKEQHVITGFYRINSNDIIDMDHCYIQSERINEVLECVKKQLQHHQNASVFRHILIKHAFHSDEIMVAFIVNQRKIPYIKEMVDALTAQIPQVKSILLNINQRKDNVILGDEEILIYGDSYITDTIHGLTFRISMKSFYQVNPIQTEVLYGKALEFAQLTGTETVIDLYCGVGTISMFLAQKAKQVIGIEIVPSAIEDAKQNAQRNHLENITFICSDAATYAKQLAQQHTQVDVVVVDPPRKGCDMVTLESIVMMQPKRIVYVSCKASTLARDLRILEDLGYHTQKIQPVDMFAQTYGVECVALLNKNE